MTPTARGKDPVRRARTTSLLKQADTISVYAFAMLLSARESMAGDPPTLRGTASSAENVRTMANSGLRKSIANFMDRTDVTAACAWFRPAPITDLHDEQTKPPTHPERHDSYTHRRPYLRLARTGRKYSGSCQQKVSWRSAAGKICSRIV